MNRFKFTRAVAACIALALLALVVQQHHHSNILQNTKCVACAVRAQIAGPPAAPVVLAAPILLAVDVLHEEELQPTRLAAPTPRAQGPPSA